MVNEKYDEGKAFVSGCGHQGSDKSVPNRPLLKHFEEFDRKQARQKLAGMAMAGLLANPNRTSAREAAQRAILAADILLAELDKTEG